MNEKFDNMISILQHDVNELQKSLLLSTEQPISPDDTTSGGGNGGGDGGDNNDSRPTKKRRRREYIKMIQLIVIVWIALLMMTLSYTIKA